MSFKRGRCPNCFHVRVRGLMIILSQLVYGKHQAIADFDVRKEISIIGLWLADSDKSRRLNYINTHFQSPEPSLDISKSIEGYDGRFDYVICSDVLGVTTPVQPAFDNLFICSNWRDVDILAPYNLEKTLNIFPICAPSKLFWWRSSLSYEMKRWMVRFSGLRIWSSPRSVWGCRLRWGFSASAMCSHLELAGFANIEKANWKLEFEFAGLIIGHYPLWRETDLSTDRLITKNTTVP